MIEKIPEKMRTKCQVYSRIVGYYAPVAHWNEGKQAEFKDRKMFKIKETTTDDASRVQSKSCISKK